MFLYYCFHIFLYLRFFLVKRHKTFNMVLVFKSFFFGLVILFFWFWVLVKCKKWFIFCIWFQVFYIFYLYWLIAWLASPFLFGPLFFFYFRHPPFFGLTDQFILFLFVIHSLLPATATAASSRPRQSSSVDCSYLQKCVRIKKLCKTHYKCYYTTMIYAPVIMPPYYPFSYP